MTETMLQAAIAYAYRGWPIFPADKTKKPLTKNGVLDATTNIEQITAWWTKYPQANIALDVGGAGMMVLDLDPGHGIKELENAIGTLPDTQLTCSTPRRGLHLYFDLAHEEIIAASTSKLAPNVDVRSFHSYVLLPPGETSAGRYTWLSQGSPSYRTDSMLRACNSAREKHEDRDNWTIEPDQQVNIDAAIEWLNNKAKLSIEGQGGDALAYSTAAMMKSYGISESQALDLMTYGSLSWNSRCVPPWDYDDLATKVSHAYQYNTSPPGNITKAYKHARAKELFKPESWTSLSPSSSTVDEDSSRYKALVAHFEAILTASGTRERRAKRFKDIQNVPEIPWIIKYWLPENGVTVIYGESQAFKTYMAINMLLCTATGTAYAKREDHDGYKVDGPREAILFAGESYRGVIQRINTAIEGGGFTRREVEDNLVLVSDVYSVNRADGLARMADEILALDAKPAIIVVDTLNLALEGNEDSAEEVKKAIRGLRALAEGFNAVGVLIDHVGHTEKGRPRGSSAKKANADVMILCEREEGTSYATLSQYKNREADSDRFRISFEGHEISLGEGQDSNLWFEPIIARPKKLMEGDNQEMFRRNALAEQIKAVIERSQEGATWSIRSLAKHLERELEGVHSASTLRRDLGATEKGWCKDHPVLSVFWEGGGARWLRQ